MTLAGLWALLAFVTPVRAISLTPSQQEELLHEAIRSADLGAEIRQSKPDEAKEAFRKAAIKYELLVESGVRNGRLYYNLGNAYFESGQIGRAILNYRRAEQWIPGDARLEHNLNYVRSLRRNQIEAAGQQAFLRTLFFWHYNTSQRSRWSAALTLYVIFWLLMIARAFFPRFRWRYVLVPVLLVWVTLGSWVTAETLGRSHDRQGVLVANDVVVRKSNGEGSEPQFKQKLQEGVEFVILEQHHDWWHIELPDGKTGWIRANQAEPI